MTQHLFFHASGQKQNILMVGSEHFYALPGDAELNVPEIWRYLKIIFSFISRVNM